MPDFFDIDPNKLDEAWLQQPKTYHEYALKLAEARADHERAKAERDVVAAEVDKDVRLHPDRYGIEKVTEKAVEVAVTLSKRCQTANADVIKARHDVDIIQAAVDTLEHRKRALQDMVALRLADYYGEPTPPKGGGRIVNEMKADRAFGKRKREG